jgi:hypothetical protein
MSLERMMAIEDRQSAGVSAYAMAVCLAALAGWVDAAAYMQGGDVYVSFMSGNSTAFGAAVGATRQPQSFSGSGCGGAGRSGPCGGRGDRAHAEETDCRVSAPV